MAAIDFLANNTSIALDKSIDDRAEPRRQGYRLKAGDIADPCARKLWAGLRWISEPEIINAKKQRIFDLGNYIEDKMIEDLRAMPGMMLKDRETDEDGLPTDRQVGVPFADGHGYGYIDCLLYGVPEAPNTVHVCEIKSMKNTDFNATVKHGVLKNKPLHYGQFQMYMHKLGYDRALYAFECKNTSERHFERVEYDFTYAAALEAKAEQIAFADHAPVRAHADPDTFPCSFCNHRTWCWQLTADLPKRTCRTCAHVSPMSGGRWTCSKHENRSMSREEQEAGCHLHLFNPDMVPGTVTGGDGEESVIYELVDGVQFIDHIGEAP